jgi:hypothetical protein
LTNHSSAALGFVLAFNAAETTTVFNDPTTWVNTSVPALSVIEDTLANVDVLTGLDTLELAGVELTELETLELASPQATKVSVKTEVVTNLKIFFILKNHLLGTLYSIYS